MLTLLHRSAATWTVLGLASGLFYREFTKANGVSGGTQLAVTHTHALTLGTLTLLVLMALTAALGISDRRFRWGVIVWQAGLGVTFGAMLVKGSLQVLGRSAADSPALAGVAGLGHMTLTAAFVLLFLGLGASLGNLAQERRPDATPSSSS
ncbi:DUF2871 domain-containing protein [Nocardioides sp. Y6]|uniref:DUF2871 domain-containing protein n=1 Tax=Nocardioides malaquae TaxID=2773426 RepID=A0ABR9RV23_9ACTN|nr:DUF2871 family protein [Nocardioides malaquae]MBE7325448.1 DUF2871 domain-containing protein [Nocardioides malaquae]